MRLEELVGMFAGLEARGAQGVAPAAKDDPRRRRAGFGSGYSGIAGGNVSLMDILPHLQGLRTYDYSGPNIKGLADLLPAMSAIQGPAASHFERQGGPDFDFGVPPGQAGRDELPPGIDTRNPIGGPNVAPGQLEHGAALNQPVPAVSPPGLQRPHTQGWRNVAPGYSAAASLGYGTKEFSDRLAGLGAEAGPGGRPSALATEGRGSDRGPGGAGGTAPTGPGVVGAGTASGGDSVGGRGAGAPAAGGGGGPAGGGGGGGNGPGRTRGRQPSQQQIEGRKGGGGGGPVSGPGFNVLPSGDVDVSGIVQSGQGDAGRVVGGRGVDVGTSIGSIGSDVGLLFDPFLDTGGMGAGQVQTGMTVEGRGGGRGDAKNQSRAVRKGQKNKNKEPGRYAGETNAERRERLAAKEARQDAKAAREAEIAARQAAKAERQEQAAARAAARAAEVAGRPVNVSPAPTVTTQKGKTKPRNTNTGTSLIGGVSR